MTQQEGQASEPSGRAAVRLRDIPWRWRIAIAVEILLFCQVVILLGLFVDTPALVTTGAYWLMAGVASVFFVGSGFTELVTRMRSG